MVQGRMATQGTTKVDGRTFYCQYQLREAQHQASLMTSRFRNHQGGRNTRPSEDINGRRPTKQARGELAMDNFIRIDK